MRKRDVNNSQAHRVRIPLKVNKLDKPDLRIIRGKCSIREIRHCWKEFIGGIWETAWKLIRCNKTQGRKWLCRDRSERIVVFLQLLAFVYARSGLVYAAPYSG